MQAEQGYMSIFLPPPPPDFPAPQMEEEAGRYGSSAPVNGVICCNPPSPIGVTPTLIKNTIVKKSILAFFFSKTPN